MRAPFHFTPQPPDPVQAVQTCEYYLARCRELMTHARTPDQRHFAQFWIDNAERQLARWRAAADRQVQR